ncbi:MAG: ATP-binding protein [Bacteroidales bacterium]|nr:ATP-binding protein [Bacteroidales bacterium]
MAKKQNLKIKPYARLLTMLGEQLMKNERIALIEIIKNSYDADADWVKVSFQNFTDNFEYNVASKIIIEDNGCGMSLDTIKNHWLNPATPDKLNKKREEKQKTAKGRIIQGEKGIGRFAMLKLGKKITITTRQKNGGSEYVIVYDFSRYDNDFLTEDGKEKTLFLDDLDISLTERKPEYFVERSISLGTRKRKAPLYGTVLQISDLKGTWTPNKVESTFFDTIKLNSIFISKKPEFEVVFYQDDKILSFSKDHLEKLWFLLNEKSVLHIKDGCFDNDTLSFEFKINNQPKKIKIIDPRITGLRVFNERFGNGAEKLKKRKIECGSFRFEFYIFDLSVKAPARYRLDKENKNIIKANRIYLYRDNIRVYPYGEPEDDWLRIDEYRGKIAAGDFLSNDQVIGCINITQKGNPKLKDKTNREGLIEEGNVTEDFIVLLQTFLAYIRNFPFQKYKDNEENKNKQDIFNTEQVASDFGLLRAATANNPRLKGMVEKTEKNYKKEWEYLVQRAETTEDLAGVGLSVETASHDMMSVMEKAIINLNTLINDLMSNDSIDKDYLSKELQSIHWQMDFVRGKLKDIQWLFKSSKQKRRNIRVSEILQEVEKLYKISLANGHIDFRVDPVGPPLVVKTTDAVLLQLFLNLIDNSIYWLNQIDKESKRIEVLLDSNKGVMIFSDNGPGINKDDVPYIFEAFYSGKGEDGRGLGLYIAKQLLERNDYSIRLADISMEKKLSGANFVVSFVSGGKE